MNNPPLVGVMCLFGALLIGVLKAANVADLKILGIMILYGAVMALIDSAFEKKK